jgi:hypothetical protein
MPAEEMAIAMLISTGSVGDYHTCGVGPDLPYSNQGAASFRSWYILNGHQVFSRWQDGNVWGSDFRDATLGDADGGDLEGGGGSDVPQLYFFQGHGNCENPPSATTDDFIIVCGRFGKPDSVTIASQVRWGSLGGGHLQFAFIDASCPMDLAELPHSWFPVFQGLHIATGFSGDGNHDAYNSFDRPDQFGAYTAGPPPGYPGSQLSVGDAWMTAGLIDIQSGCTAVVIAAGVDRADAIDRRDNERVTDNRSDPQPNWFAWRWITLG